MKEKKYLTWRKKISISQKKRWDEIRQVAEFKFARELLLERYKGLKRVSDLKYLIFELELEYKSQVLIRKHESFLSLLALEQKEDDRKQGAIGQKEKDKIDFIRLEILPKSKKKQYRVFFKDGTEQVFELKGVTKMVKSKLFVCVLCDKTWYGVGNNPAPVKKKGLCCNKCNEERVIPARLKLMGVKK